LVNDYIPHRIFRVVPGLAEQTQDNKLRSDNQLKVSISEKNP